MTLSQRLISAIKLSSEPAYRLAIRNGLEPTVLSKMIHGAKRVKPNDPRIRAIGRSLGLKPAECFEGDQQ